MCYIGYSTFGEAEAVPMEAAYLFKSFVGVPRIELGHLAPKASVLPVYDTPTKDSTPKQI